MTGVGVEVALEVEVPQLAQGHHSQRSQEAL